MSNEKLTLEQLSAYLPYELKMVGCQSFLTPRILEEWEKDEWDITPILRPMSNIESYFEPLYGQLEHQDVTDFLDEDYLNEFGNIEVSHIQNWKVETLPYGTLKVLLKHHFDVFDLIPIGLAVSVHDVSQH